MLIIFYLVYIFIDYRVIGYILVVFYLIFFCNSAKWLVIDRWCLFSSLNKSCPSSGHSSNRPSIVSRPALLHSIYSCFFYLLFPVEVLCGLWIYCLFCILYILLLLDRLLSIMLLLVVTVVHCYYWVSPWIQNDDIKVANLLLSSPLCL